MGADSKSTEALLAEIEDLKAQCIADAELMVAARERIAADAATIGSLTQWRDEWRAQAESLQAEVTELRQALARIPAQQAAPVAEPVPPAKDVRPAPAPVATSVATIPVATSAAVVVAEVPAAPIEPWPAVDRVGIFTTLAAVADGSVDDSAAEAIAAYGFDPADTETNITPVEILPTVPAARPPRGRLARLRG